ncbi:MAG: type IX secretion system outer membrane channel protein PorV [Bacteroidaceae bacterium]|nr:type IX secretion system outer membrane channel protein PorV [Bacteroidaceae bacterium]
MKIRIFRKILLSLLLLVASVAAAQDKQNMFNPVNTSVTSLTIAPDARAGAMGDLGAATEADINSQYWNPAKYPFNVARAGLSVSYTPWLRKLVNDINLANVTGFFRFGDYSAVHASLRYFSLGEVFLMDGGGGISDMTIKPYELAVDVGYSRMLTETFSMGVNMRFILSDIKYDYTAESSSGKAFGADIAMYRLGYFMMGSRECSFGWGINISNIGSKITFGGDDHAEFIPTNLRIGMNWTIPFNEYNKFSIAADANKLLVITWPRDENGNPVPDGSKEAEDRYYNVSSIAGIFKSFADAPGGFKEELEEIQWSVGAEYTYNDRFMLRAGYHHESENKGNRKYFTVGAGFHMSVFNIDAAYVFSTSQTNPLDQTMRFTLGFDLDGMKDLFGRKRR